MLQWRKLNVTVKLFMHVIQTTTESLAWTLSLLMLLEGTWNNVVVNQYKEAG